MLAFPKPGPEHAKLRRLTGAWTARIKLFDTPGGKPQESNGEFLARMDIGGYFLCRDVNYGLQGFQGRALTGYDMFRKTYVGTWVDSMSPIIYPTEGRFDERGAFCEISEGPDEQGKNVRVRMTTELVDATQMLFRMYRQNPDGSETIGLEIAHTRRRFVE